jgi:ABC-type transport system involved in cytochrome c biogenesis ATPase subunit
MSPLLTPETRFYFENFLGITPGVFYHVTGPSGSGKSTLLRLIIRLEEPTQGCILFNGAPLTDTYPPYLRRAILYLPQTPVAMDGSVRDYLLLPFTFKANQDLQKPDDSHLMERLKAFLLDNIQTGQILAGADPLLAIRYQIVVMVMIVGSTAIGSFMVVYLVRKRCFGPAYQLLLRPKNKR